MKGTFLTWKAIAELLDRDPELHLADLGVPLGPVVRLKALPRKRAIAKVD